MTIAVTVEVADLTVVGLVVAQIRDLISVGEGFLVCVTVLKLEETQRRLLLAVCARLGVGYQACDWFSGSDFMRVGWWNVGRGSGFDIAPGGHNPGNDR